MSNQLERILGYIKELKAPERAELDRRLLEQIASDAEDSRKQYRLVLASNYLDDARSIRENWGKLQGIPSGYPSIDKLTKGFVGGEVTVIGGATSNGKTSLAVNIAARVIEQGKTVLFVTLEMTKAQLTGRMMFTCDNFEDLASLIAFQEVDELNWESVDGLIANAVKELKVDLVIVDHLHYFTRELQHVSEDLGRITKEFKKNASRHNVPIILISHTRKGEGDNMDDLRGSSYIAQDADIVLMVKRRRDVPNSIAVTGEKNRNRGIDFDDNVVVMDFDKTRITEEQRQEVVIPWNT